MGEAVDTDFKPAPLEFLAQRGGYGIVFRHEVERRAKAELFFQFRKF